MRRLLKWWPAVMVLIIFGTFVITPSWAQDSAGSLPSTIGGSPTFAALTVTSTNGVILGTAGGGKLCFDGPTCSMYAYKDASNNINLTGANVVLNNANFNFNNSNIGLMSAGTMTIGTPGQNTTTLVLGSATTTDPVKLAGGSGAFVNTCTMSAGTSCTATVPTGALCWCFPQTAVAVGANIPFGATASTTFTCNSGGTANSAVWTVSCM